MTTPRKRWFRVADSIGYEPWSNDVLAAAIRLMALMSTRWCNDRLAPDGAGEVLVSSGELCSISGCSQPARALRVMRQLSEHVTLEVEKRGNFTLIRWPKWAEFQGVGARRAPPKVPLPTPTPTPTPTPALKKEESPLRGDPPLGDSEGSEGSEPELELELEERPPPARWAVECAAALVEHVRRTPGARIPHGAAPRWARELEALVREVPSLAAHEAPGAVILSAIDFAFGPENLGREYEVVIRSGASLREKWPKLVAAAQRRRRPEQEAARVAAEWDAWEGRR